MKNHIFTISRLFFFGCAVVFTGFITGTPAAGKAPLPKPKHRFVVIAHRGQHTVFPENSLASFDAGAKAGVDYVEMDLRTTRDSVLVILHDGRLDRTTNGKGPVSEWNFADLARLRLKDGKGDSSLSVPEFGQVLAVCRNRIGIYLDFKSASIPATMNLIRRYGMEDQVIVYINSPAQYVEWRQREPRMPIMISLPDTVKSTQGLNELLRNYPVALLDGDYTAYTCEMLKAAGAAGIAVWPDIQGDSEDRNWQSAIDTGFGGLQTDHPQALIGWLEKRGLR